MNKLVNLRLLLILFFVGSLGFSATNVFGQKGKPSTILSVGHTYFTSLDLFHLGNHGVEISAELLLNDEKIGIKVPFNLQFDSDLFLDAGLNVRFYTNHGKFRGFVGPKFSKGRQITDQWDEGLEPYKYSLLSGDMGIAYHANKLVLALNTGYGRALKEKENFISLGLSVGLKL